MEENNEVKTGRIETVNIDRQMRSAYIDYSMSVIVSRALPDVRDGLKPVHRRVLFGMEGLGLSYTGQTKKSARIVGEVLGKYHPHGDSSVYDAMVRMAQFWSMRYPLVFGQGNFGSMDGDPVAAMRYTEAKLTKLSDEVLADLDKDTVDMANNFDDTLQEPTVLPTKAPLLLLNGSSGIAVGMATNMAPHNMTECCDAICAYIDNPEISVEELMHYIKGPDFPTGGIIQGTQGIRDAFETGRGRIVIRSKTEIEVSESGRETIVVTEIPYMKKRMEEKYGKKCRGRLFLKEDNRLAIAGSVKARGGIYEVLKHTEDLALVHGLLKPGEGYEHLGDPEKKRFFKDYTIQVGSTGNLGLSIGIISAVLGYKVIIHMSADAKQWKKDLLRSYGVDVREYRSDYGKAVEQGRKLSARDEKSYFVDDENSKDLFLGYATAGKRIADQLQEAGIAVDQEHPLFVYIPCGVGGAPGGITFGLKEIYGDHVHCFFAEPVQAPCMLLGMSTGLHDRISVEDVGLTGKTQADGLAVGRPSAFVGKVMEPLLSGAVTVEDEKLYRYMKDLLDTQNIFLEPSACAGFQGPVGIWGSPEFEAYLRKNHLEDSMDRAVHVLWATGGSLVPEEIRRNYIKEAEKM